MTNDTVYQYGCRQITKFKNKNSRHFSLGVVNFVVTKNFDLKKNFATD